MIKASLAKYYELELTNSETELYAFGDVAKLAIQCKLYAVVNVRNDKAIVEKVKV